MGALEDEYLLIKTSNYRNLVQQAKEEYLKNNEQEQDTKTFGKGKLP